MSVTRRDGKSFVQLCEGASQVIGTKIEAYESPWPGRKAWRHKHIWAVCRTSGPPTYTSTSPVDEVRHPIPAALIPPFLSSTPQREVAPLTCRASLDRCRATPVFPWTRRLEYRSALEADLTKRRLSAIWPMSSEVDPERNFRAREGACRLRRDFVTETSGFDQEWENPDRVAGATKQMP